jgi:putative pyridoxal-dependent aspartate 1-decarboxylase
MIEALIQKLSRQNIDVDVIGQQLKLRVPEGVDAAAILEEVRQNKEDLLSFIIMAKAKRELVHREFWTNEFKDGFPVLQLPEDGPVSSPAIAAKEIFSFDADEEDVRALYRIATSQDVTLFPVLLSLYTILLSRLGNQEDIVVGVHSADGLVALRNYPVGAIRFSRFINDVHRRAQACFEHQAYRLPDLRISTFFSFGQDAGQVSPAPEVDLALYADVTDQRIRLRWEYPADQFRKDTVEKFAAYLRTLISSVARNPEIMISDLCIVGREEMHQLLFGFNDTWHPFPGKERIMRLFEEQSAKFPGQIALRCGDAEISWKDLVDRVTRLSSLLKRHLPAAGQVVAVLMERGIDSVIAMLAILKCRCTYLPIDPYQQEGKIAPILQLFNTACLITRQAISAAATEAWKGACLFIDRDEPALDLPPLSDGGAGSEDEDSIPDAMYILYTSGLTADPKGVAGSQQGLLSRLHWMWKQYPYTSGDICCQHAGIHSVCHITEILAPLLQGVPVVILEDRDIINMEKMVTRLTGNQVSRITLTPSLLWDLINMKKQKGIYPRALTHVFCSGETLLHRLAQAFMDEFTETRLVNMYGTAGTGGVLCAYDVLCPGMQEVLRHFSYLPSSARVTFENIDLEELKEKFTDSRMAAFNLSPAAYYDQLQKEVIPYSIDTAFPAFIGHMTSILPGYIHDMSKLVSRLNQNLVKIETSKSFTFLERQAIAILHRSFYSQPEEFYRRHIQQVNANLGIITSGGSTANISALLSARNKALYPMDEGQQQPRRSIYSCLQERGYKDMVILGSELMHYSFRKAMAVMGLGSGNLVIVDHDRQGRLCVSDLEEKIRHCRKERLLVLAIVAIAGSTETGSIDPLPAIAKIARQNGIHFHVDAAWGGALIFSRRHRQLIKGIEEADSVTFCGHKQLYLPQGISLCLFKDPGQLNYNSVTASYQAASGSFDTGQFTIEGSRPALSLCLHASLHIIGKTGYGSLADANIERAALFVRLLAQREGFELISNGINIVNYRYIPPAFRDARQSGDLTAGMNEYISQVNRRIQERQFYHGRTFVSKTVIRHQQYGQIVVFRAVFSNPLTRPDDLVKVLNDQVSIIEEQYNEQNQPFVVSNEVLFAGSEEEQGQGTGRSGRRSVPVGKPIYNVQVMILDKYDHLQPVGVPGEICVSVAGPPESYPGREDVMQAIAPNPYVKDRLMHRTGDLGKWSSDGEIIYLGRKDRLIKIRGFRIEPGEIEQALYRYEGIRHVVVIAGEDHDCLTAYYVEDRCIDATALQAFLLGKIPGYMVPAVYIRLDHMPLMPGGKINRDGLPPAENMHRLQQPHTAPQNILELKLTEIWQDLLGKEEIGIDDNFFELGGTSLAAVRLASAVRCVMNINIPLNILYRLSTIRLQAQWIEVIDSGETDVPEEFEEIIL